MTEPILNTAALQTPRNRRILFIVGAGVVALLLLVAIWQMTGTRAAKRDLAGASDRVAAKQREVDDARRTLEQKLAELRAVRADADVQATKLGGVIDKRVNGLIDDARPDAANEYYVRDRNGEFVKVARP